MTITREINGETITIELTEDELRLAYMEAEHDYDVNYANYYILELYEDEETLQYLKDNVDDIAYESRRLIDEYYYRVYDAMAEAVRIFKKKLVGELE